MILIGPSPALVQQLAAVLENRRAELQALVAAANRALAGEHAAGDVVDLKDVAAEDTRAAIDEVAHAHAAAELAQVAAALCRVRARTYGQCEDCGEPIDERRLRALPATAYCLACQAIHERPGQHR